MNDKLESLAELFKLFDDATRLRILKVLIDNESCVNDIALNLNMTQSSISHQLKVLKQGNLVKDRKEGKKVFYSIKDECVRTIINVGLQHIEGE